MLRWFAVFLALAFADRPALAQDRFFQDCPECPQMERIPAGSFTMGVPAGEEEREGLPQEFRGRSAPQIQVAFARGFALGVTAVTRAEYLVFERATGHPRGPSCWHLTLTAGTTEWSPQDRPGLNWWQPSFAQTSNHPVVCVSWDDAQAYVGWLSRRTGQRYRLPSEAEWEYAARAGTAGPRYWSGGPEVACAHANVRDRTLALQNNLAIDGTFFPCSDGYAFTAPANAFPANLFGLHQMLGNVWQWTADCWNPDLQEQGVNGAARNTGDCSRRVVRGGSWLNYPWSVRAGARSGGMAGDRDTNTGFRVAKTQ